MSGFAVSVVLSPIVCLHLIGSFWRDSHGFCLPLFKRIPRSGFSILSLLFPPFALLEISKSNPLAFVSGVIVPRQDQIFCAAAFSFLSAFFFFRFKQAALRSQVSTPASFNFPLLTGDMH